jgi:hypothetical protein
MMNFENTEKSLPEKLSDDIVSYILEKEMKPGDKLPNEAFLAKEMFLFYKFIGEFGNGSRKKFTKRGYETSCLKKYCNY